MTSVVDVCVVGGGPAGASLAVMLARSGYRVAVVEQRAFPREHVGESLSRGAWPLLDSLFVSRAAVEKVGIPVRTAAVRWRSTSDDPEPHNGGLTVDRGRFDDLLLDRARAAGAEIHHGRAHRPTRTVTGWRVDFGGQSIEASFLADATGRRALLGGHRTDLAPRTHAVHARWSTPPPALPDTLIGALSDGWLWCARLPGGDIRAMVFIDPARLAEGDRPDQLLRQMLSSTEMSAELADTMPDQTAVEVCDASSYRFADVVGLDAIRVGEAAFAIDPLSSSGIQTAIQTGLAAAATVHTVLSPGADRAAALEYYADMVETSANHHRTTAGRMYAEHVEHADRDFWRTRRLDTAPAAFLPTSRVADLLAGPVRLRDSARLRSVACRVGDRIERRRALCSPQLDRPVGFLGGQAIAPLIDEIEGAPTLAAVLRSWESSLPPHRGDSIVSWLVEHDLLEPASP